eukprot:2281491-Pyramimonas_sp.AAC.1
MARQYREAVHLSTAGPRRALTRRMLTHSAAWESHRTVWVCGWGRGRLNNRVLAKYETIHLALRDMAD